VNLHATVPLILSWSMMGFRAKLAQSFRGIAYLFHANPETFSPLLILGNYSYAINTVP
jgi:hypothetical protein